MRFGYLGSPDGWYFRDLQRAAGSRHQFESLAFESLEASVVTGAGDIWVGEQSLRDYDAVLVRSMPLGSLEQVVFRMNVLGRLAERGTVVVNPPRSLEIAIDKYLALTRLEQLGIDVPKTMCCQSWEVAMSAFEQLGGDVVVKPLFGGEGRGIMRITDSSLALRTFKALQQLRAVIYLQQYIANEGADIRMLVLGGQVFAMRRVAGADWRTNISQGGRAERYRFSTAEAELAVRVSDCIGCPICALDLLPGKDGKFYALEVNAVPGWRALAAATGVDISVAAVNCLQTLAEASGQR